MIRQNKPITESINLMKMNNPTIIPRNYKVEEALHAAVTNNDYSIMKELLDVIKNPYDYSNINEEYSKPPKPTSCAYKTYCGT